MRRSSGLTLLEILIALFVFGIVAAMATSGVTSSLRVQALNEASTSAQAKLRRITEVFTQELRSAVLGGITNLPYASNSSQISFLLLDGGAGYQVVDKAGSFSSRAYVDLAPTGALSDVAYLNGREILLVNNAGEAYVMRVTGVANNSSNGMATYRLNHAGCSNTIAFTPNTLVLSVRSLGLRYDGSSGSLLQRDAGGAAQTLAFDMDGLELEYVYQYADGTPIVRTTPLLEGSVPVRRGLISGQMATLTRVQVTVSASENQGAGREVTRSYMGQVEMSTNPSFQINRVRTC
ncbi:MAG: type II secretion system protein [Trueperaceae bacterium]|nr:type II secretion system protein [Trueperaceae bacterium]